MHEFHGMTNFTAAVMQRFEVGKECILLHDDCADDDNNDDADIADGVNNVNAQSQSVAASKPEVESNTAVIQRFEAGKECILLRDDCDDDDNNDNGGIADGGDSVGLGRYQP